MDSFPQPSTYAIPSKTLHQRAQPLFHGILRLSSYVPGKAHYNRLIGVSMHQDRGCAQQNFEITLPACFEELWLSIEPSE